ncbi:MAG: hypothetical protein JNL18_00315 [Planctomycetaceae bacterium]|nr:hypothetical protein [Planctomycetaceae bacterium]
MVHRLNMRWKHSTSCTHRRLQCEQLEDRRVLAIDFELLTDLNSAPIIDGSTPSNLVAVGNTLFFTAHTDFYGVELWKTDGTAAGTSLVKDIRIGAEPVPDPFESQVPRSLVNSGGILYFLANDGTSGFGLWRSDGTSNGTFRLKDASSTTRLVDVAGTLFFAGRSAANGQELWRSDGTIEGTRMVKDIRFSTPTDTLGSNPSSLTDVNGVVYFSARGNTGGYELWKSDGTEAGTTMVKDIRAGSASSSPTLLTNVGGVLYFRANDGVSGIELWKSDGTANGTQIVADIFAGPSSSNPDKLVDAGGRLFFEATDGAPGAKIWLSDGNSDSVTLIKTLNNPNPSAIAISWISFVNNIVYFSGNDGSHGVELWTTDGSQEGTVPLLRTTDGSKGSGPGRPIEANGTTYFSLSNGQIGRELWKTDGTSAGTTLVADVLTGQEPSSPSWLTALDGKLFFAANDGSHGSELWSTDGTATGTTLVRDIRRGTHSSNASNAINIDGVIYFTANDGATGMELWKIDSNDGGVHLVKDIEAGPSGSNPSYLTNVNGVLYFVVYPDFSGTQSVWASDGTDEGTRLIAYNNWSPLRDPYFTLIGDELYFSGYVNSTFMLWRTDGSEEGLEVIPPPEGEWSSGPIWLEEMGGRLYFKAANDPPINGLWKYNEETQAVEFVHSVTSILSSPTPLIALGSELFYVSSDGVNGFELWKSDGQATGSELVKDIYPGYHSGSPMWLYNASGTLYFFAKGATTGYELWRSDGTSQGTYLIKDIRTGPASSLGGPYALDAPPNFTECNGIIYFSALQEGSGFELWRTDGTEEGTYEVADIQTGPGSSSPQEFSNINGILYFQANDAVHGNELWRSDGTELGTFLVKDFAAGVISGNPRSIMTFADRIVLVADTDDVGSEVWIQSSEPTGDFDRNNTVDGNDFLLWQREFGKQVSPLGNGADGNGDGMVGGGDLDVWQENFGLPESLAPESAVTAAVAAMVAEEESMATATIEGEGQLGTAREQSAREALFAAGDFSRLFGLSGDGEFENSLRRRGRAPLARRG